MLSWKKASNQRKRDLHVQEEGKRFQTERRVERGEELTEEPLLGEARSGQEVPSSDRENSLLGTSGDRRHPFDGFSSPHSLPPSLALLSVDKELLSC